MNAEKQGWCAGGKGGFEACERRWLMLQFTAGERVGVRGPRGVAGETLQGVGQSAVMAGW